MSFGLQQAILIVIGFVGSNLPRLASMYGNSEVPLQLPSAFTWIFVLILNLAFFRYFFWLAWTSERGDRFFKVINLPRERVLSGFGSGALRWYCHVDERGIDLDAR